MRFKQFEGEWEKWMLNDLGDFVGGGTPTSSNSHFWDGNIPWVSSSDLNERDIHTLRIRRFITQDAIDNSATKLCIAPVILIVSRVGVGKVAYSTESVCTSQDFTNIVNIRCNGLFLSYLLGIKMRKQASNTQGTSIKGISTGDIKKIQLFTPTAKEQQKISSLLALIDKRISTQSKIISQLESLMRSLKDEIFSQQVRFKDGNGKDFPKWNRKKLGEIGETYNGLTGKTKENFGSGKQYIQYRQIFDDSKIDISRFGLVQVGENENQSKALFGDVFFTTSSETPIDIGTASVLLDKVDELYLNSFCFGFRANSFETLSPYFARYLFRSAFFRNDIMKLAQGSTRYNMSKVQLLKLEVLLPSYKEQAKIGDLLGVIDKKIDTEKALLKRLEKQKKYLLQNLFI